jgi:hypothetical protein
MQPSPQRKTLTLTVRVTVTDPAALRKYARSRYQECWGNDLKKDFPNADLGRYVYEALVASNTNPSPDTYGIALREATWQEEEKSHTHSTTP